MGYAAIGERRLLRSLTRRGRTLSRAWVYLAVVAVTATVPAALWADEGELLSEADRRMRDGNHALALEVYDAFLNRYPNSESIADAHFGRGVSLYHLGRYADALSTFDLIERRYRLAGFLDEIPYWTGITHYQLGGYEAAALDLMQFVRSAAASERRPHALLYLGLAELQAGRVAEAQEPLGELVRRSEGMTDPTTAYAAVLLAHSYLAGDQHEELVAFASGLPTVSYPPQRRDQILFYQAEGLWELDRVEAAAALYSQLVAAAPEIAAAAHRRLFAAARRGGDISAMQRWTRSAETRFAASPEILADLWLRMGIENYDRGADELAEFFLLRVWEQELASGTSHGTAPLYLAATLIRAGRASEAAQVLRHLVELAPGQSSSAVMLLGSIALEDQRFADAADLYGRFGSRYPDSPRRAEAGYLAAYASYRAGDLAGAARAASAAQGAVPGSRYHADLLRLQVNLARRQGLLDEARQIIDRLIELGPDDVTAQIDRMKLAFSAGDHEAVVDFSRRLRAAFRNLAATDPAADALAAYLQGVSEIALKRYRNGIELLRQPGLQRALRGELAELAPTAAYQLGWALYRLGEFGDAATVLDGLPSDDDALFLAGWAYYSHGRFEEAAQRFGDLAQVTGDRLAARALYLHAKSLRNLGRIDEAQRSYRDVWERHGTDGVADDALFEYAETVHEAGEVEQAVVAFELLADRYDSSPLRAEALYRSAEALLDEGAYQRAKDGFFRYRQEYPTGGSVPAALYWGGVAADSSGESFEAVFMWSNLIDRFPESSFYPEALNLRAQAYVAQEDYNAALASLGELIARHPQRAEELGSRDRAEEVRLLLLGLTGREAELSASVARLGREKTAAGRKAMLELARLYVFDATAPTDLAFQLLRDVIETDDPAVLAPAQLLLGEYYLRRGDLTAAARAFLDAALAEEADDELRVLAIYRSAQAEAQAGRREAARALAQRILDNFPGSQWVGAARAMVSE